MRAYGWYQFSFEAKARMCAPNSSPLHGCNLAFYSGKPASWIGAPIIQVTMGRCYSASGKWNSFNSVPPLTDNAWLPQLHMGS